jgi:hypothetical protein
MNFGFAPQFLKPGKALCSAAFPTLCATWNWMLSALSNLTGDADGNAAAGHISVDWSAPFHPVVRCKGCDASGTTNIIASAWLLSLSKGEDADDESSYVYTLRWCYYNKAGVSYLADDMTVDTSAVSDLTGIVAVKFVLVNTDDNTDDNNTDDNADDEVSAKLYASIDEVRSLQKDPNVYVVPLYSMTSATEWVDLRTSVQLQVFDFAEY